MVGPPVLGGRGQGLGGGAGAPMVSAPLPRAGARKPLPTSLQAVWAPRQGRWSGRITRVVPTCHHHRQLRNPRGSRATNNPHRRGLGPPHLFRAVPCFTESGCPSRPVFLDLKPALPIVLCCLVREAVGTALLALPARGVHFLNHAADIQSSISTMCSRRYQRGLRLRAMK